MFSHHTQQLDMYLCERCRKPLGSRQVNCPRRQAEGEEGCAYQVQSGQVAGSGLLMLVVGAALIGLVILLPPGNVRQSTAVLLLKFLLAASGLGYTFIGCYRQWGRVQSGRNPDTGQTWQRTMLFGIELHWVWQSGFQPVAWPGSPARVIRYPASVAEFCRQGNAVDIVSTALLQLFAQEILNLGRQEIRRRFGRRRIRYLVLAGECIDSDQPLGALETRMVEIVSATVMRGLPLEAFLSHLLEGGTPQPRNFLIDRFVGPEAEALGLGKVVGARERSLAPATAASAKAGLDIQSVEQLYRDLWIASTEEAANFLYQMDRYIIRLIRNRTSAD